MDVSDGRIPVTLVAGFLGAGKTTLLRRVLTSNHGMRIGVLVNDFGTLNIDARIVSDIAEDVISLANGCLCCTVAGGLSASLRRIVARHPRPDHLLIECSGVAEPDRVAASLRHGAVHASVRLDAVVTLVDLAAAPNLPAEVRDLAESQIVAADIVILNKTDLAPPGVAAKFRRDWLFPDSRVIEAVNADVPIPLVLGAGSRQAPPSLMARPGAEADALFDSCAWATDHSLSINRLRRTIAALPPQVFRAKGVFRAQSLPGEDLVMQLVGSRTEWWRRPAARECSAALFIGLRGQLPGEWICRELDACIAPDGPRG
jgi:G3E family GTPase